MVGLDAALSAINAVYAAAEGHSDWNEGLAALSDLAGYEMASMEVHNVRSGQMLNFESARIDPEAVETYTRDFALDNPRVNYLRRGKTLVSFDHLFMSEWQMDNDGFYADFLKPRRLKYFVSVESPLIGGEIRTAIALQRSGQVTGVDEHSIRLLSQIEPHLKALPLTIESRGIPRGLIL